MKSLEKGQDKIQQICDKLRHKTLEPAEEEARKIITAAEKKREQIIKEGELLREELIKQAREEMEKERTVFHSSLEQAAKQAMEKLRQEIEHKLFNEELQVILDKQLADPRIIAELINGIVKAIEKEGLETDLSLVIPRLVSPDDISDLLIDGIKQKLKGKTWELASFAGGVQIKLPGKKMTIDVTDQTIKELLANYVRKDFRKLLFG